MAHILDLPEEIILIIFGEIIKTHGQDYLLLIIPKICKRWSSLCYSSQLWTKFDGSLPADTLLEFSKNGYLQNTKELVYSKTLLLEPSQKLETIFAGMPNLKAMNFTRVHQFTPEVLACLRRNCKNVCTLKVCNWFFEADAAFFDNFLKFQGHKLTRLELTKLSIRNFSRLVVVIINECRNLEQLELGNWYSFFKFPLQAAQERCTKLKVLSFSSPVSFVSDGLTSKKLPGFPLLEAFKYSDEGSDTGYRDIKFTDKDLKNILSQSPLLKELNIRGQETISANAIVTLPATQLKNLDVSKTKVLNSQISAIKILTRWESLSGLDISYTKLECINEVLQGITSESKCSLRYLNLGYTNVTNKTVLQLLESCWRLEFLDLFSCEHAAMHIRQAFRGRHEVLKLYEILVSYVDTPNI